MSFIWPAMLLSLLLVPLLAGLYWRLQRRRRTAVADWGMLGVVQDAAGRELGRRRHLPPAIFMTGLALLLVGLARPQMFVDLPRVEGTVILAFDVSNSMLADDFEPTRMAAAKAAARRFVENQPSTVRIGVVAFSNGGLVVQPPTDDDVAVLDTIERLTPQGGTSLGHGIFTALNAIAGEAIAVEEDAFDEGTPAVDIGEYGSAVIVLLTDGENTGQPEPLEIAQIAAEAGVRIYPIGVGSQDGAIIELDGFQVLTQLNERPLQEIAGLTNGEYFIADDVARLTEIYDNIDLQLTIRGEETEITSIVAGLGMLVLLLGGALALFWLGRVP